MAPSTVDQMAADYLTHCELVQREPVNTLRARRRVLLTLPEASTATREDLETWWASRAHLATSTRIVDLALVRGFYRWAMLFEHRGDDPTIRLRAPRAAKRPPRPARRGDIAKLLADETLAPELKRAIVLGAFLGQRRAEIAAQDWADIDPDRGMVAVTGKGNKTRIVAISETTLALLGEIRATGNVVRPGNPYSADVLGRRLNRAMAARGVHATCHQLRHFFGTTALEASGGDLRAVQDMMGHESMQTTAGYTLPRRDIARLIADSITGD